eukprot:1146375-Pelagomonas_calceolata.AAC.6
MGPSTADGPYAGLPGRLPSVAVEPLGRCEVPFAPGVLLMLLLLLPGLGADIAAATRAGISWSRRSGKEHEVQGGLRRLTTTQKSQLGTGLNTGLDAEQGSILSHT